MYTACHGTPLTHLQLLHSWSEAHSPRLPACCSFCCCCGNAEWRRFGPVDKVRGAVGVGWRKSARHLTASGLTCNRHSLISAADLGARAVGRPECTHFRQALLLLQWPVPAAAGGVGGSPAEMPFLAWVDSSLFNPPVNLYRAAGLTLACKAAGRTVRGGRAGRRMPRHGTLQWGPPAHLMFRMAKSIPLTSIAPIYEMGESALERACWQYRRSAATALQLCRLHPHWHRCCASGTDSELLFA